MACLAAISGLASALVLAAAQTVTIGTEVPFPPFTQLDERGEIVGFERDVGDEVCRRAMLRCDWVAVRFDALLPGVATGRFDIAMAGIAITPGRMEIVDFSVPYDKSGDTASFLGRHDAPEPGQARIGVQSGTIYEDHLRQTGRRLVVFGTEAEVLDALQAGRVDLGFCTFPDGRAGQMVDAGGFAWLWPEDVPDMGTAMALCKGNDALLRRVNAALNAMLADGTIDEIAGRWMM